MDKTKKIQDALYDIKERGFEYVILTDEDYAVIRKDVLMGYIAGDFKYETLSSHAVLGEVRTDVDLAIKLSKYVHDNCKEVPHDIGMKLIEIISEHLA
jgi:hypothetical protein